MASSSSSSNAQGKKYEVFISFRGADVRNNFLSHLLAALKSKQIKAFVDDTDLERGKRITPTLLRTIEESYVSIIIFSENYPNSEWCLDELHKILQCMEEKNQIAVPVFYHVDPSVIQDLKQNYALTDHKVDAWKLENWRYALQEISNLSGFNSADSQYQPEARLCDEIANDVSNKLSGLPASYPLNYGLFDIDSRIEDVVSLIEKEENTVSMVGIWGMKGVGKTTLADKVFNKIKSKFDGHCFVFNVKQRLRRKGAKHLIDEIIQKLLGDGSIKISTPHTIDDFIRRRLKDKKLLIVLDDVDDPMHLKSIIIDSGLYSPGMFFSGSRIIVTSKDKRVFENVSMEKHIYEVKQLNDDQAHQLFRFHAAFDPSYSLEEYEELSMKVVNYAKGLPLALKVLGCDLKDKQLKSIHLTNILQILRTSFDELDWNQKGTFLDIACFFKEHEVKYVERILECFDFYPINGIDRLCDKSLISIGQLGTIQMHDLLQQMGQDTVVKESRQMKEKQSRLWKCEDIEYVLRSDRGTENVEGISLYMREIDDCLNICSKAFINMHKLRFLRVFGFHSFLSSHDDFKKVCLPKGLEILPNSLRYLHWEHFPLSSLPCNFSLEKLVELHMPYSNLKELVWDKPPQNLKRIRLDDSSDLIKISNLGEALNLEIIELYGCKSLVNIGPSLEKLESLIEIDLRRCTSLYKFPEIPCNIKKIILTDDLKRHNVDIEFLKFSHFSNLSSLPNAICNLKSLKTLDISHCKNFKKLPDNLGTLESLEEFNASKTALEALPSSFCNLKSLKTLDISHCKNFKKLPDNLGTLESLEEFNASQTALEALPSSFCNLRSLKTLKISQCKNLYILPDNLETLESLEVLDACESALEELPSSFCNLRSLKTLNISHCKNLYKLPDNLGTLESLEVLDACESALEELPSSFCILRSLKTLNISHCKNLYKLPDKLETLESLEVLGACESALEELPSSFCNLRSLKTLNISHCKNLYKLPGNLGTLESLEVLGACESALEELPSSFCNLRSLKTLNISHCKNLYKLPENLGTLESLEVLDACESALEELPSSFCNLKSLKTLNISHCNNLYKLPGNLGTLESLEVLNACESALEELPSSFCNLRSLKTLNISHCKNLYKLQGNLGNLESLEVLDACESALEELPFSFCNLRSLKTLNISHCKNLYKLPGNLGTLESLEVLDACESALEELPFSVCNLRSLKTLNISHCNNLYKFPNNLGTLESLEVLDACESALEELPSSFCNLRCLKTLNISHCKNLYKLPDNLGTLESLEVLNACESALEELPSSFCNLRSLKTLNISHCKNLCKLLDNLGTLESLEVLDACESSLEEFPSSFCKLRSRKTLNISHCKNRVKVLWKNRKWKWSG